MKMGLDNYPSAVLSMLLSSSSRKGREPDATGIIDAGGKR
jgi:hypothetical protein